MKALDFGNRCTSHLDIFCGETAGLLVMANDHQFRWVRRREEPSERNPWPFGLVQQIYDSPMLGFHLGSDAPISWSTSRDGVVIRDLRDAAGIGYLFFKISAQLRHLLDCSSTPLILCLTRRILSAWLCQQTSSLLRQRNQKIRLTPLLNDIFQHEEVPTEWVLNWSNCSRIES